MSYFELYNEVINDLLNPGEGTNLLIREDKKVLALAVDLMCFVLSAVTSVADAAAIALAASRKGCSLKT